VPERTETTSKTLAAFNINVEPCFRDTPDRLRIYTGDSLDLLDRFPERSVNMIFADPPYFLSGGGPTCHGGRRVSVNKGDWDRPEGVETEHRFTTAWLEKCRRVLDNDGTIWVSGTTHVIHSVGFAMQQLGYRILNDIIWFKSNAPPNLGCRCFTHSTETILWAAKSRKSKHTFNYRLMKEHAGGRVLAGSRPDDVVLDPFSGSGTTGLAALEHGRRYIGIELEPEYVELSVRRIESGLQGLDTHPQEKV